MKKLEKHLRTLDEQDIIAIALVLLFFVISNVFVFFLLMMKLGGM